MPVSPAHSPRRSAAVESLEGRRLMTTNTWRAAVSGSWETAGDWSLGHVPTSSETVAITVPGSYTVAVHGTTDVANSVTLGTATAHGPTLALSADDTVGYAILYVTAGFTNDGTVKLTDNSALGYYPQLTAATLTNAAGATLTAAGSSAALTGDFVDAPLANAGTVAVTAARDLYVSAAFSQAASGTFDTALGGGTTVVSGPATLGGLLDVTTAAGFKPVAGHSYPILDYASRSGDFSSAQGLTVSGVTLTKAPGATAYDLNVPAGPDTTKPTVSGFAVTKPVVKATTVTFAVTYADNVAVNAATLGNGNVTVTGPGGFSQAAKLVSVSSTANGTPRTATYSISPVGGKVDVEADGTYTAKVNANSVNDTSGNAVAAATAGTFTIAVVPVLAFTTQPTAEVAGKAIAPAVVVRVEDASGRVLTSDTSKVTIAIATGPSGATVGGTATVAAAKGVATFADLVLTEAGAVTLRASDGADVAATSSTFVVSAAAATKLAFVHAPSAVMVGKPVSPAITVAIEDAYGNAVTGNTSRVTLSIATGPAGGKLTGTTTAAAVAGVATFANLAFSKAGSYTVKAVDGSLTSAITGTFTAS